MFHRYSSGIAVASLLFFSLFINACGPSKDDKANAAKVAAKPADPTAGKALSKTCSSCHGTAGIESDHGAPFIAGQQPDYFKAALKEYSDGHRNNDAMVHATNKLTDTDMANLAAYYASLPGEWNSTRYQEKPTPETKVSATDVAKGKQIAGPCLSCHGVDGNSKQAGIPSIAGFTPEYLKVALKDYFNKTRQDPVMQTFSRSISSAQIHELSTFLSTLRRTKPIATVSGNTKRGAPYAKKVCSGCHGDKGNSINPAIPSLTGQNAAYIIKALKAYRSGSRKNAMMKSVLKDLPHQSDRDIAAYYAEQQPTKFGEQQAVGSKRFDPVGEGALIANTCNGCHGPHGNSVTAGIPSLTRLYPEYIKTAITAYKSGTRQHAIMKSFVSSLSEDDIERLGLYYATQKATSASTKQVKGAVAAGAKLTLTCAGCHGEHGNSEQANVPSLAGQNPSYILNALHAYRSGSRQQSDMEKVVKELNPGDDKKIAAYYAVQTPQQPKVPIPEDPIEISAKCDRCHGANGYSAVLDIPRIGGQIEAYLVHSLQAYKHGKRTNSTMQAMSEVLSNLEIRAIAQYYSKQSKAPDISLPIRKP